MAAKENNPLRDIYDQGRVYLDAKIDEIKLRSVHGLSLGLSRLLSSLLLIVVLSIVIGIFSYAGVQWLNMAVGAPWGTLIVGGVLLALLICLFALRKRLFLDSFVKMFIGVFFDESKEEEKK